MLGLTRFRWAAGATVALAMIVALEGTRPTAQAALTGLSLGSIYALGGVGLTLVYGILRLSNFSHGELMTFGGYVAYVVTVTLGEPFAAGIAVAVVATAALALALERGVWRRARARRAGVLQLMLTSIGLAFALRGAMQYVWGPGSRQLGVDNLGTIEWLGLRLGRTQLLVIVLGAVSLTAMGLVLRRTLLGRQMRAVADSTSLAEVSGIDSGRIVRVTWLFAGALAGLGGVLSASVTVVYPSLGFDLLLPIFAAVILGGIGDVFGALAGGLLLGLAIQLSTLFIPDQWKVLVGFVVLIVILACRPTGLLGQARAS